MTPPGTETTPLRVAIIGSGPSGFYAAGHLLTAKGRPDLVVEVDMFDRLPTPWGLVRGGVAPDHPNIKAVSRVFEKTAAKPGFRFFGNVEVGRDISHEDLVSRYHAVIYAVGAETDKRMGIPGEDLPGSVAATEFVAWYNGHPDHHHREFDLSCRRAVVVGNGNVAMDVARMLAITPAELERTDVADHALEVLRDHAIEEIVVLGRRGPAQAAFTNPELLELGEMLDADVVVDPEAVALDEHSARSIESEGDLTARKNVEILTGYSEREPTGKRRRIILRFLVSPVAILGEERVEGVELVHNEIGWDKDGVLRPVATERREIIEAGIVLRSIGYRGVALPGVPFDDRRGTIPHEHGRVIDPDTGTPVRGEYTVGWIKRGPSGVIGTNKKDAHDTVDSLLADLDEGALHEPSDPSAEAVEALVTERRPDHVTYAGWQAIDRAERSSGEPHERPRVKLCTFEALLAAAYDPAAS
ncbi:MAG TPA: FAD-dependent oxidoreductase [Solirubrobacteraceae bacterium]|jgi:ferredoxin--NADP+ reductase|nr:FAD-dependent oxidoreductase [Solirubrobacteraceae bacterium]